MKHEKLLQRFLSKPKDFTFDELESLLAHFGYTIDNRGKTSGSAISFYRERDKDLIQLHRPHSPQIMKIYQIRDIVKHLEEKGDIEE
ncbi:MAG: type II toxin-antitoxin system HicA family toxin [Oscillospiraceae bacterium]|nr:type II toxin-antitoxin system HicA family toxin [Oscillospiraceae bacterium]